MCHRPAEKGLPHPAPPAKIGKSSGAGRNKVDLNPLKILIYNAKTIPSMIKKNMLFEHVNNNR